MGGLAHLLVHIQRRILELIVVPDGALLEPQAPGTELARRFGVRPNLWELADDKPIITEETGAEDEAKEIVEITELPPGRPTLPDDFETFDL